MSVFQASLINPATGKPAVVVGGQCTQPLSLTLTITDWSNYLGNSSPSSSLANFSNFIKITVTHLPSGTQYTMQSTPIITPTTTLFNIPAPSTGHNVFTLPLIGGDGGYALVLQTVPTYDSTQANYIPNISQVYNPTDGAIYTCILAGANHQPNLSPTYWALATEIGFNYTDIETIYVDCQLNQCILNFQTAVFCNGAFTCENICADPNGNALLQLLVIQWWINYLTANNQLQNSTPYYSAYAAICAC